MLIGGFQKTSLIDYPQKIACTIFTCGCNFRCSYCHNPELLTITEAKDSLIEESFVLDFLKKRKGKLDAVVISGGEPCLQKDLIEFMSKVKEMRYLIKLDTNGTFPEVIEQAIAHQLLDYIAMDIKAPLLKYHRITGTKINEEAIKKSIEILKKSNVSHEFRTTVLKQLLSKEDILNIAKMIENEKYYLQKFVPSKIYDKNLENSTNYTDAEFEKLQKSISEMNINCSLR